MKYMKYFESALKNMAVGDEFDISVHCDVKIFEWLLNYIENEEWKTQPGKKVFEIISDKNTKDENRKMKPEITVPDVISILISAEYLLIPNLVEESLRFFAYNMNQVLQLPLDLSCIKNNLLKRIIEMVTDEQLEAIVDKKDWILSRIYMLKLENLV